MDAVTALGQRLLCEIAGGLGCRASTSSSLHPRSHRPAAEQAGLTAQQHQALLAIKGHRGDEPLTIGVLAERLAIQPHSAVGLIDRLAAKGLIRRRPTASDRRQIDGNRGDCSAQAEPGAPG